jgi:hypothetical protein
MWWYALGVRGFRQICAGRAWVFRRVVLGFVLQLRGKGISVSMFVSLFWINLTFVSCGQLIRYKLLDVKDG